MTVDGKGITQKLKEISSKLGKNKYIILVLIAGIVLLLLPADKKEEAPESSDSLQQFSLTEVEKKLGDILSSLDGAGNVKVMLSVKDEGQRIIAKDREVSESGGDESSSERKEETVLVSSGSSKEDVVALGYIYPEYQGALVAAEGAKSARVRLDITEAVSAVTGLSADNIKVIKMK